MALPQAVEQAEELANQLYAAAYPTQGQAPAEGSQPASTEAVKTEKTEDWQQKYRVLAGKYNAEVPTLTRKNRELSEQVNDLSAKLTDTLARVERMEAQSAAQPLVRPEEVQEFGEPLVDLIRRASREEASKLAPADDRVVKELRTELNTIKAANAKTADELFFTRLTELVPDWVAVNGDDAFHAWLAEIDPLTGAERQTLLSSAQSSLDASRVAQFFKTFKAQGDTRAANAQANLEQQVTPNTQSRASAPTGKVVFTRREVAQFYADWRAGRIPDAEAIAKEVEINRAITEGRLR